ncbi:MAG TPA: hypothetical protein VJX94_13620 [Stellaceae bacterium]|nr:hypothetical protein [Stellaceae bacterium]
MLTAACFGAAAAAGSAVAVALFLRPPDTGRQQCRLAAVRDGFRARRFARGRFLRCRRHVLREAEIQGLHRLITSTGSSHGPTPPDDVVVPGCAAPPARGFRLRRQTNLAWNSMAAELSPAGKRYHISASANYV